MYQNKINELRKIRIELKSHNFANKIYILHSLTHIIVSLEEIESVIKEYTIGEGSLESLDSELSMKVEVNFILIFIQTSKILRRLNSGSNAAVSIIEYRNILIEHIDEYKVYNPGLHIQAVNNNISELRFWSLGKVLSKEDQLCVRKKLRI